MRRVNVVGTSGAGKTTFAADLAEALGVPHVELDALHWEPNWVEVSDDEFRRRVGAATARDGWVVDGNYGVVRDLVWPRADAVVWLDYSFPLVLWRSLRRTLRRALRGEPCCNGNRESLRRGFSRDSLLLWVLRTYGRRRREFRASLPALAAEGREVVVLRSPGRARQWLASLRPQGQGQGDSADGPTGPPRP